jgi:hypothetical protein
LFSIETKYGFENVLRMSATFTLLPLELPAPLEVPELLERLEPHAATVNAATVANVRAPRLRRLGDLRLVGWPERWS